MGGVSMSLSAEDVKKRSIKQIYHQKEEFIVIGLTGQKGSGCSSVAKILGLIYKELNLEQLSVPDGTAIFDPIRDERIIEKFAYHHWSPFDIVYVRDVIMAFIIRDQLEPFMSKVDMKEFRKSFIDELKGASKCHNIEGRIVKRDTPLKNQSYSEERAKKIVAGYIKHIDCFLNLFTKSSSEFAMDLNNLLRAYNNALFETWYNKLGTVSLETISKPSESSAERNGEYCKCYTYVKAILPAFSAAIKNAFQPKVNYTIDFQKYGNLIRFWGDTKEHTNSESGLSTISNETLPKNIFAIPRMINCFIKAYSHPENEEQKIPVRIVIDSIKNPYENMYLRSRYSAFYLVSVTRDDIIRKAGLKERESAYNDFDIELIDYNEHPSAARKLFVPFWNLATKSLIDNKQKVPSAPCDGDGNPLKDIEDIIQIISSGSTIAPKQILVEEGNSNNNCTMCAHAIDSVPPNYTNNCIRLNNNILECIDELHLSKTEISVCESILSDPVRVFSLTTGLYKFFLQDIESCIQDSDIFIANNETDVGKRKLKNSIVRYVALIMHPGLVTPTPLERCMQIAYTAKLNSGCISRQVGAVVTDDQYKILSLGWNDVPCGQTSCNRRSLIDLCRYIDPMAFSDYEKGKGEFRKLYLSKFDFTDPARIREVLDGVPAAFCFKDAYCEITHTKNQIHTRAMHGEEKALLTCDQQLVRGGYLFTTSSPCELCAKNAKEHHIKKIYYIEPYPGISQSHVCNSGDEDNRAQFELFQGAIGRAYTQLYTPIIPLKDELDLRGFYRLTKS